MDGAGVRREPLSATDLKGPTAPTDDVQRGAVFDRSGAYRYVLSRQWPHGQGRAVFILLNPSTADANRDDPTIRRCMGFAHDWGYARLEVLNLFAYRATKPDDLRRALQPEGPSNRRYLRRAVKDADLVLLAWGIHGSWRHQNEEVLTLLRKAGSRPTCLGRTAEGHPKHVLYLPRKLRPQPFIES